MTQLAQTQSLVAMDEEDKPWDVSEALQDMAATNSSRQILTKLVYERWTVELDDTAMVPSSAAADTAPSLYKKGVVAMRSLYTYTKYLPAWRFGRRLGRQAGNAAMLRPRYRVVDASSLSPPELDTLTCPLFPSEERSAADTLEFAPLNNIFGALKIAVSYRKNCDFLVEPTERLLSTRAMRSSEHVGRSALPVRNSQDRYSQNIQQGMGSRDNVRAQQRNDPTEASASGRAESHLERSPFDKPSRLSTDLSAARNVIDPSVHRRPSVSFQPFKAGSLSSSPNAGAFMGSPSSSFGRNAAPSLLSHSRSKSSITTLPQQALRTPQIVNDVAIGSSGSSSPKPAPLQRYSSSFGNRKSRFPSSGNIRNEDDNSSSGRASVSSAHRGSGSFPDGDASSASVNADDDNIADFLKLLDKNKGLQSFSKNDQAVTSQRAAAQYSKFARMRESTTQLTESMSSSLMLQRSFSSSSRQLQNVPGMIPGSSLSTSSSPGKPISPHTPHMPAVPSRLSNQSIMADYSRESSRARPAISRASGSNDGSGRARSPPRSHGTPASVAIDIPTSPRTFPTGRRSSSAAQQARIRPDVHEQDVLPYGLRSASLPNDQGAELSLSELLIQNESGSAASRRRREIVSVSTVDDDDEPLLFALAE